MIHLREHARFNCMLVSPVEAGGQPWLLLIHQIPPKPDYFRVKIGRRLARIGAVAIKNSVYVLPATESAMEDVQWILREIVAGGGEASICRSTFVDGLTDGEIERFFHEARSRDYDEITADARATLKTVPSGRKRTPEQRAVVEDAVAKLRRRVVAVTKIDFFGAPRRDVTSKAIDDIEAKLGRPAEQRSARTEALEKERPRGRTWVTRKDIFVDRIASAWLIRRFIDTRATLKFVPAKGYAPGAGELRDCPCIFVAPPYAREVAPNGAAARPA